MAAAEDVTNQNTCFANMSIHGLINRRVFAVYEGWSIQRLTQFLVENTLHSAPVVAGDGELLGEVSLAEVLAFQERTLAPKNAEHMRVRLGVAEVNAQQLKAHKQRSNSYSTVNMIMRREVQAVDIHSAASTVCRLLLDKHLSHVYVTEAGCLVGLLAATDFLRHSLSASEG